MNFFCTICLNLTMLITLFSPINSFWDYVEIPTVVNTIGVSINYASTTYIGNGNYVVLWTESGTTKVIYSIYDYKFNVIKSLISLNIAASDYKGVRAVPDYLGGFLILYDERDSYGSCNISRVWAVYVDSKFRESIPLQIKKDPTTYCTSTSPDIIYTGLSYIVCYNAILQRLVNSPAIGLGVSSRALQHAGLFYDPCSLADLKNGHIAVAYEEKDFNSGTVSVYFAIINESDLTIIKGPFDIGQGLSQPHVALLNPNPVTFLIIYIEHVALNYGNIWAQTYDEDGNSKWTTATKVNSTIQVDMTSAGAVVLVANSSGFVVVYDDVNNGQLYYQLVNNDGTTNNAERPITCNVVAYQDIYIGGNNNGSHFMVVSMNNQLKGRLFYSDTFDPQNPSPDIINNPPTPSTTLGGAQIPGNVKGLCTNLTVTTSKQKMPKVKLSFNNVNTSVYFNTLPALGTLVTSLNGSLTSGAAVDINDVYYWANQIINLDLFYYTYDLTKPQCTFTLIPCFISCYDCNIAGDTNNHQCTTCDTTDGYYQVIDNPTLCYREGINSPIGYFLENNIWKRCYKICKTCSSYPNNPETDMQCNSCIDGYYPMEDYLTNCFQGIIKHYFFNGSIYRKCFNLCKSCTGYPTNPVSDMLCESDSCIDGYFPKIDNMSSCFYGNITGYYFNGSIYQKCYSSCEICEQTPGTATNHQCKTCLTNYYPKIDNISSCFTGDQDAYYLDGNIYEKCYPSCLTCTTLGTTADHKCTKCVNNFYPKIDNLTSCFSEEQVGYFFDGNFYQKCEDCESTDEGNYIIK
jgi:hypothetical protein